MRRRRSRYTRGVRWRREGATSAHLRLPVGAAAAVVAGVLVAHYSLAFGLLAAWLAGAAVIDIWTWAMVWRLDPGDTRAHAKEDDPGRRVTDVIMVLSSLASLGAIAYLLLQHAGSGRLVAIRAGLCVVSVLLSWITVHTMFTLRYAHVYYSEPDGGINFNQPEPPQYSDFAYFAFTIGMSYAVSDTNVGKPAIRRLALQQALLSYLLGAIVIGATINLLVSLPGSG